MSSHTARIEVKINELLDTLEELQEYLVLILHASYKQNDKLCPWQELVGLFYKGLIFVCSCKTLPFITNACDLLFKS